MAQITATFAPAYRRRGYAIASIAAFALFALCCDVRIHHPQLIDFPIALGLNALVQHVRLFDHVMVALSDYELFQGVPVVGLAVAAFYVSESAPERVRLAVGVVAAAFAALLSRGLQLFLPNLPRPFAEHALHLKLPYGGWTTEMLDWSSFPSDHAALLCGVAAATLIANRRIGYVALAWTAVSQFSRAYYGLHYATDLVAGALLAVGVVCAATGLVEGWEGRVAAFSRARPVLMVTIGFIFLVEMASLFDDVRQLAAASAHDVKRVVHILK